MPPTDLLNSSHINIVSFEWRTTTISLFDNRLVKKHLTGYTIVFKNRYILQNIFKSTIDSSSSSVEIELNAGETKIDTETSVGYFIG